MPTSSQALARAAWISACHFHDLTEREVLSEVARRVSSEERPLVLFDLDSTLYEVGPRTLRILREWNETEESRGFPEVRAALSRIEDAHMGYSILDAFRSLGLEVEAKPTLDAARAIKPFWAHRFFSSAYLPCDRPYPGAAAFVTRVQELGARVVYLTGRDEPGMGEGTRRNLARDGFPCSASVGLLLKRAAHLGDLEHKVGAAESLRRQGTLVASFENEPANLAALRDVFPDAMHVFVDTVCSENAAAVRQGLYRIRGFQHE